MIVKKRLQKVLKIFLVSYACFFAYHALLSLVNHSFSDWFARSFNLSTPIKYLAFCTINFAIVLWYLIAMIETYIVWYFVVKFKKEQLLLWLMPLLFLLKIALTTYCETKNLPWMFKINFLTCAMPFFLFGYYIHKKEIFFKQFHYAVLIAVAVTGGIISLLPILFDMPINFSVVGVIIYSLAIFAFINKLPNKSYCKPIEYVGSKLSLNVYVFHVLILSVVAYGCRFFNININSGIGGWFRPLLIVALAIIFALAIEWTKNYLRKRNLF